MNTCYVGAMLLVFRYPFLFVWLEKLGTLHFDNLSVSSGVNVFANGFKYQHAEKICKLLKLFSISIYQYTLASRFQKGSDECDIFL